MPNKYLLLAIIAGALVAFAGWKGYKLGKENERALWLKKQVIEVSQASTRIKQLEDEARVSEAQHALKLAAISNDLNGVINDIETLNDSSQFQRVFRFTHPCLFFKLFYSCAGL